MTVPASFDPAARELTVEAAKAAGCRSLTLLEEPQAALYSWIEASGDGWRKQVRAGRRHPGGRRRRRHHRLLADRGARARRQPRAPPRRRRRPHPARRRQHGPGARACRRAQAGRGRHHARRLAAARADLRLPRAKERLLGDARTQPAQPIVVPGRGSKLVGGSIRTELTRDEVERDDPRRLLSRRSKPRHGRSAARAPAWRSSACPMRRTRRSPATWPRSSAGSSARWPSWKGFGDRVGHGTEGASFLHPTAVLFNGGVFKSPLLAERTLATLNAWLRRRRRRAGAAARRRRPRPRGRPRRGLLRLCAARPRRPHPRRHGVRVLRRRRIVDARGAGHRAAGAGAVRRAVRHGRRHRGRAAGARARRSWSASPCASASSPRRCGARMASARCSTPGPPTSCRSSRRSRPRCHPRGAAPASGAGAPARPRHRGRHARARSRAAQRRRALEGRVRRARRTPAGREAGLTPDSWHQHDWRLHRRHRPRHHAHRRRLCGGARVGRGRRHPPVRDRAARRARRGRRRGRCCRRCATTRRRASWRRATWRCPGRRPAPATRR